MMTTLALAAHSMHGSLTGADGMFDGVSIDTRTLQRGELFVALDGPNFRGGDYLPQAKDKGAAGAVVGGKIDNSLPQIKVKDTRAALGDLGAAWRRELPGLIVDTDHR